MKKYYIIDTTTGEVVAVHTTENAYRFALILSCIRCKEYKVIAK